VDRQAHRVDAQAAHLLENMVIHTTQPINRRRPGAAAWQIVSALQVSLTLRWSALAILLTIYTIFSLQPFAWRFPVHILNGATPIAGGWSFPIPGVVVAEPRHAWLKSAKRAESLELSLELRPQSSAQSGPARILTISDDIYSRNLMLAQDGDDLVLRLRSEDTSSNGVLDGRPVARVENVLQAGRWVGIDIGIHPGRLTIAIDGRQELEAVLPPAVLATWNSSFGLALGNEMTCNRPWLGEIRNPVITAPDGATIYAEPHQVERPASCWAVRHAPKLIPLVQLNLGDAVRNIVMYIPLGCLLGLIMRTRNVWTFGALLLTVAAVSGVFETAQLFVPRRFPSVDDLIFNTLGGALGLRVGFWLKRRAPELHPG
jgi:VanZ like family